MAMETAKIMQYVNTGEVCFAGQDTLLNSGAIGSCVIIAVYDSKNKMGIMAHVMLPGKCPSTTKPHTSRYAANAVDKILSHLKTFGSEKENIQICLVGGANVLKRKNDHIGIDNLESIAKLLMEQQLAIKAKAVGGFERRTALFDIGKECIYYTVGNSKQKILWQIEHK